MPFIDLQVWKKISLVEVVKEQSSPIVQETFSEKGRQMRSLRL